MHSLIKISTSKAFLLLGCLLLLVACEQKTTQKTNLAVQKDPALAILVIGQVTLTRNNEAPRLLKARESLFNNDAIETGDGSHLSLQVRNNMIIKISPRTQVRLNLEDPKKELDLKEGEALVKLAPLSSGESFQVHTPLAVVGVRGTQFITRFHNNTASVAVGEGKVSVVKTAAPEKIFLTKDMAADIKTKTQQRKLNSEENLKLQMLDKIPVSEKVEAPEIMSAAAEETRQIVLETDKLLEKPKVQEKEEPLDTLERLRNKFGRIDVITLYNGKVIKGVILKRGKMFQILTPTGAVKVSANDIESTKLMP